jgi:polyhydroxyalkanoate synthase
VSANAFDPAAAAREMAEFSQRFAALLPALRAASAATVGCTSRDLVWSDDKISLYRYRAIARPAGLRPLLVVFALVNRPYVMDLQPDRSLIRALLSGGLDVYLIEWGNPDGADRFLNLNDYINGYLHRCVQHVLKAHAIDALNVLGVCQGGTFSLCYTALHPANVRNLITMVTPVDFKTPDNLLSKWVQGIDIDLMVSNGNVSGDLLNAAYLSLMPFRLTQQKYVALACAPADPPQLEYFMRMERWIFDSPDVPAEVFREFAKWFYQENRLVAGTLEIGGRKVSLKSISQPLLNIYATKDHIVPPSASQPLQRFVGSTNYRDLPVDIGHIGMYVSSKARQIVPASITAWLQERP